MPAISRRDAIANPASPSRENKAGRIQHHGIEATIAAKPADAPDVLIERRLRSLPLRSRQIVDNGEAAALGTVALAVAPIAGAQGAALSALAASWE
jgi:hypothetical protein